ncbi:hypothetical protein Q1695_010776 [Nippostrongylus brasiliensis]|nr:hypothetical protein Q1695_010776 [Nippostrongylus brasiliensis]
MANGVADIHGAIPADLLSVVVKASNPVAASAMTDRSRISNFWNLATTVYFLLLEPCNRPLTHFQLLAPWDDRWLNSNFWRLAAHRLW